MYIRAYWAGKAFLDGTWTPPNGAKCAAAEPERYPISIVNL
jgi:hypothetical protein